MPSLIFRFIVLIYTWQYLQLASCFNNIKKKGKNAFQIITFLCHKSNVFCVVYWLRHPNFTRAAGVRILARVWYCIEMFLSAALFSIVWWFGLVTKELIHLMVDPKFNSCKCLHSFSGLLFLLTSGRIYNWLRVLII